LNATVLFNNSRIGRTSSCFPSSFNLSKCNFQLSSFSSLSLTIISFFSKIGSLTISFLPLSSHYFKYFLKTKARVSSVLPILSPSLTNFSKSRSHNIFQLSASNPKTVIVNQLLVSNLNKIQDLSSVQHIGNA